MRIHWWNVCCVLPFWSACGGGHGETSLEMEAQIHLTIARATSQDLDSLVLSISAEDMDTLRKSWTKETSTLEIGSILPGSQRALVVEAFADGFAVQRGETVLDLVAGETRSVTLNLTAIYGYLTLTVPLGLANPLGVTDGILVLSSEEGIDTLNLEGTLPNRYFQSGGLELGQTYTISIVLLDSNGTQLYSGLDTVLVEVDSPELSVSLGSLVAELSVNLSLDTTPIVNGWLALPGSESRTPESWHDLVIVELLPNPKTSGDDWEYTEIFNATLDTLLLDSCALAKTIGAISASTSVTLTGCSIPPGNFRVIGRDSVPFADCSAGEFTLTNSGQTVVLHCGDLRIDSIVFHSASDSLNPFPLSVGASIQIPVADYAQRDSGAAWCAGVDSVDMGNEFYVLGSPGEDAECP
ncbi:MAG TPA: hypothetical protein VLM37_11845 [Fibrobacteraceae bacterium]|nr:hypothetical protein [Fibrobacteraceae bacterium]